MSLKIGSDKKLNEIINSIETLSNIVDKLDSKLTALDKRLDHIKETFNNKITEIEKRVENKADVDVIEELRQRLNVLENSHKSNEESAVMKESYEKRFNLLIHGITESVENVWETPSQTLAHVQQFMKDGLQIDNPAEIALADYHRLPQRPLFNDEGEKRFSMTKGKK